MKKKTRFMWGGVIGGLALAVWLVFALGTGEPPETETRTWRAAVEREEPNLVPEPEIPPPVEEDYSESAEKSSEPVLEPDSGEPEKAAPSEAVIETEGMFPPSGDVRIAIIIDDMGMGAEKDKIDALPAEITLSYLPYAPRLRQQVRQALEKGHEVMLHLPMEPMGRHYAGPGALSTTLPSEENAERLSKMLDSAEGYVGVNNHMGSKFTRNSEGMELVVQALRERGLYFVDSRTGAGSLAGSTAKRAGVRTAERDIFIDDVNEPGSIEKQLRDLEKIARRKGYAVAIGHPRALTLSILERWLHEIVVRGARIVPVSEIVR